MQRMYIVSAPSTDMVTMFAVRGCPPKLSQLSE